MRSSKRQKRLQLLEDLVKENKSRLEVVQQNQKEMQENFTSLLQSLSDLRTSFRVELQVRSLFIPHQPTSSLTQQLNNATDISLIPLFSPGSDGKIQRKLYDNEIESAVYYPAPSGNPTGKSKT